MNDRDIFMAALDHKSLDERTRYLDGACGDDRELRGRVDSLLQSYAAADSFLETPVLADDEALNLGPAADRGDPQSRAADRPGSSDLDSPEVSLDFLEPCDVPGRLGKLGAYDVLEIIGRGGMGVVLRAHDPKLNRVVAIKVLAPKFAAKATARERFLCEAQAAAAVSHPHVVTIHGVEEVRRPEVEEAKNTPYLVMECIDGPSLRDRIELAGTLQLAEILRIGSQIAAGLAAAHAQGLTHCDVKPGNILLENGVERVKITDFGLARAVDDVGTIHSGEVAGTPQYMSPEQTRGEPLDHRSDLFSFGSVLYAMCTGRSPFRSATFLEAIRRVREETPQPIREVNSEMPDWLTEIIDRLLAKDPADRFQSAAEVAQLLSDYLAHLQGPSTILEPPASEKSLADRGKRRHSSNRRRIWRTVAAAVVVLFAGLGLAEVSGVTELTATVIRVVRGDGTLVVEIDDPNVQVLIDGEELVVTGAGPNEIRLRPGQHELHATKDGKPLQTTSVTISRGGRQVVKVTRQPTLTSEKPGMVVRRVASGGVESSGRISPDGRYLSYANWSSANVAIRDLKTGKSRDVTTDGTWEPPETNEQWGEASLWSPDGKQLAYKWSFSDAIELRVVAADGTAGRTLYRNEDLEHLWPHSWSADGTRILFYQKAKDQPSQLAMITVKDGSVKILKSFPERDPGWAMLAPGGRYMVYGWRPTDKLQRDLYVLDIQTSEQTPLVENPADDWFPLWTPDGRWIVFFSDRRGSRGLWAVPWRGGRPGGKPRFIRDIGGDIMPVGISRDGSYFFVERTVDHDLYTAGVDLATATVTREVERLDAPLQGVNLIGAWSPDGKRLAWLSETSLSSREVALLTVRRIDTGEIREFRLGDPLGTLPNAPELRWSADGRSLILRDRWLGYFIIDAASGQIAPYLPESFNGECNKLAFSRDGRYLYFAEPDASGGHVSRMDLDTHQRERLYEHPSDDPRLRGLHVSPDGRQLAFCDRSRLWVMPSGGGPARVIHRTPPGQSLAGQSLAWAPDSNSVLGGIYSKVGKGVMLWQFPTNGGEPGALGITLRGVASLRVHPDGRQILFASRGSGRSELWALDNLLTDLNQQSD